MAKKNLFTVKVVDPTEKDVYLLTNAGDKIRYNGNGFDFYGPHKLSGEEDPLMYEDWFDVDNADEGAEEVYQFLLGLAEVLKKTMDQKKVDKR